MTYVVFDSINGLELGQADSTLSWVDATRTLTLTPTNAFLSAWVSGLKVVLNAPVSIQIPDVTGLHVITLLRNKTLSSQLTATITNDTILKECLVAIVYWNATQQFAVLVGDERHAASLEGRVHEHLHNGLGSRIVKGSSDGDFALTGINGFGNGDKNSAIRVSLNGGEIVDEGVFLDTTSTAQVMGTPAASTPLDSDPIAGAEIPTLWRAGAAGDWFIQTNATKTTETPLLDISVTVPGYTPGFQPWNQFTGSKWQLTSPASGEKLLCHLFAVNDIRWRVVAFVGQAVYTSITDLRNASFSEILRLQFGDLPTPEFVPLHSLLLDTNTGFDNAGKARFVTQDGGDPGFVDWRLGAPFVPPT